jgi:Saxitoxin biosynthesis operon protein SxtJ
MKPDTSKSTVLVICMGFLVLFLVFGWKWALYTSLGIGVLAIASTFLSQKIEWLWMKLSVVLGFIVPNILLSILFFVFLLPIALLSRLVHKDPLKLSGKYKSYFVDVNKQMDKAAFEKTW